MLIEAREPHCSIKQQNATTKANDGFVDPNLTFADLLVLRDLLNDIQSKQAVNQDTADAISAVRGDSHQIPHQNHSQSQSTATKLIEDSNSAGSQNFRPTIFTTWDAEHISPFLNQLIVKPYSQWAQTIVRNPTDVVFVTHTLLYLATSLPSAVVLYVHFTWLHGVAHWIMTLWYCGAFNLMLHNHIHNQGLLQKRYSVLDSSLPFVLEPLMGHTWNSYYYHHVKHHHVENNGPDDLSSTIRYQRDEAFDFSCYVVRFCFFIWAELPWYFVRKRRSSLAVGCALSELGNYLFIFLLARWRFLPTLFVFLIPLFQLRLGLMAGNWGQHALVDEMEPASDFRSSITLIDVPSNRFCFNDGYHTSHHLNPLRHWRDHPRAFLQAKEEYRRQGALVFRNIDYLMLTYRVLKKDYLYLAKCLVPIGDQIGMSQQEIADMLRTKTRRFSEADIERKFKKSI